MPRILKLTTFEGARCSTGTAKAVTKRRQLTTGTSCLPFLSRFFVRRSETPSSRLQMT